MKKPGWILVASLIVIFAGCQQSQQKQTTDISRKDRLVASENLNLKNELAQCRSKIEKQKELLDQCRQEKERISQQADEKSKKFIEEEKLLEQCRQEKEKIDQQADKDIRRDKLLQQCEEEREKTEQLANENIRWLMDELPQNLLSENTRLTEENEKLTARIIELEKALKQSGLQEQPSAVSQPPPTPSPNEPPVN
jgi:cysteinyl-tRNA synthetase